MESKTIHRCSICPFLHNRSIGPPAYNRLYECHVAIPYLEFAEPDLAQDIYFPKGCPNKGKVVQLMFDTQDAE